MADVNLIISVFSVCFATGQCGRRMRWRLASPISDWRAEGAARPGLGASSAFCDCANNEGFVNANHILAVLVSINYLVLLCTDHCLSPSATFDIDNNFLLTNASVIATTTSTSTTATATSTTSMSTSTTFMTTSTTTSTTFMTTSTTTSTTFMTTSTTTSPTTSTSTTTTTAAAPTTPSVMMTLVMNSTAFNPFEESTTTSSVVTNVMGIEDGSILSTTMNPWSFTSSSTPDSSTASATIGDADDSSTTPMTLASLMSVIRGSGRRPREEKSRKGGWANEDVRSNRWCPEFCPNHVEPVCGSDGVIYGNQCQLAKLNCHTDVIGSALKCSKDNGSKCDHHCPKQKDLVCGTDARTYLNKCYLDVETCLRDGDVQLSHLGACASEAERRRDLCPKECGVEKNFGAHATGPVCGSDGNVYRSQCEMHKATCGLGVVSVSRRHCLTTSHCDSSCSRVSRLACGSDGKLYNNGCQMRRRNCGRFVYEVPVPFCLNRIYRTDCPTHCDDNEERVCGSDGNVYSSLCELKKLTCGYPLTKQAQVEAVSSEQCVDREQKCEIIACPLTKLEVCGNDNKTYLNKCHLAKATCLNTNVQLAHHGPCVNLDNSDNCPQDCPNEPFQPICASNGNVYSSECEMQRRTCGQRVVKAPLSECRSTAFCEEECDKERSIDSTMVCGSDGNFYASLCHMNRENCGGHVYAVPLGVCLRHLRFEFRGCGRVCPADYDPVCGSDNKTYSNECFLQMENCRARALGGVVRRHFGTCADPDSRARHFQLN